MQQVTANVLVDKARQNQKLLKQYKNKALWPFAMRAYPAAGAAVVTGGKVKKGYLLLELQRKGQWVKVRDLFAHEGWTRLQNIK